MRKIALAMLLLACACSRRPPAPAGSVAVPQAPPAAALKQAAPATGPTGNDGVAPEARGNGPAMQDLVPDATARMEQARGMQCAAESLARARLAKAQAALDQWKASHAPVPSPSAGTPTSAETREAAVKRAALEKDIAAAAVDIPTGIPPTQFNQLQADLRLALAKDRPDDARRLIAEFGNSNPPPLASQTEALLGDLRVYAERGSAPFLTGIRTGK